MDKYIVKNRVFSEEPSELDFVLQEEFKPKAKDYFESEFNIVSDNTGNDGHPIKIDLLIGILEKAKAKGATHAQIEYHSDHYSYLIDGVQIREANEKEIADWKQKKEKRKKALVELEKLDKEKSRILQTLRSENLDS